jgi:hypothetical protein
VLPGAWPSNQRRATSDWLCRLILGEVAARTLLFEGSDYSLNYDLFCSRPRVIGSDGLRSPEAVRVIELSVARLRPCGRIHSEQLCRHWDRQIASMELTPIRPRTRIRFEIH